MERLYRKTPLNEIPWNIETPPDVLVDLVESGKVKPCKAIDLGCGTGNYSIYLASVGFDVTGIDNSPTAIKIAQENAKKKGIKCNFLVANVLGNLNEVNCKFEFAFDWGSCCITYSQRKGEYMLRMCINYSILVENIFLFVLVKRIPALVVQENIEKHDWGLFCIFLLKMN